MEPMAEALHALAEAIKSHARSLCKHEYLVTASTTTTLRVWGSTSPQPTPALLCANCGAWVNGR